MSHIQDMKDCYQQALTKRGVPDSLANRVSHLLVSDQGAKQTRGEQTLIAAVHYLCFNQYPADPCDSPFEKSDESYFDDLFTS